MGKMLGIVKLIKGTDLLSLMPPFVMNNDDLAHLTDTMVQTAAQLAA
jgi:adenosylmethionine-8-amino-7-oxononanoate aminotransferase